MQYATTRDGVCIAYMSLGDGPPVVFTSNIFGDLSAYLGGWPATREGTDRAVNQGWRVAGYALDHALYCDIALQRGHLSAEPDREALPSQPAEPVPEPPQPG